MKFQRKNCEEGECEEGTEICKGLFEEGQLTDVSCLPAADRIAEQTVSCCSGSFRKKKDTNA